MRGRERITPPYAPAPQTHGSKLAHSSGYLDMFCPTLNSHVLCSEMAFRTRRRSSLAPRLPPHIFSAASLCAARFTPKAIIIVLSSGGGDDDDDDAAGAGIGIGTSAGTPLSLSLLRFAPGGVCSPFATIISSTVEQTATPLDTMRALPTWSHEMR